jgi:XrtJ-associated TM-motif-TM protein
LSKDDVSAFTNAGDAISPDAGFTGGGLMNGQSFAIRSQQAYRPEKSTKRAGSQAHRSRQMIKTRYVILSALALLAFATSLRAQDGCTDSPEAPTALLMLVGSAGMFYGSSVLRKVLRGGGGKR